MTVNELREWCKKVEDLLEILDDGTESADGFWMVLGAAIALGTDYAALCFRCKGCEKPYCWYPGLYSDTMHQFRSA